MHTPVLLMPGFMILARLSSRIFNAIFAKPDIKSTGVCSQNQYLFWSNLNNPTASGIARMHPKLCGFWSNFFPKVKGALAPFETPTASGIARMPFAILFLKYRM